MEASSRVDANPAMHDVRKMVLGWSPALVVER